LIVVSTRNTPQLDSGVVAVNDVRNLMDNLHTHVEYKEFEGALRAPAEPWSVLQRLQQAADAVEAPAPVHERSRAFESPSAPPTPQVMPHVTPQAAAPAGQPGSLLQRYAGGAAAAEVEADAARRLPLAEVFARLERPVR
jgi:hypothetical protein